MDRRWKIALGVSAALGAAFIVPVLISMNDDAARPEGEAQPIEAFLDAARNQT